MLLLGHCHFVWFVRCRPVISSKADAVHWFVRFSEPDSTIDEQVATRLILQDWTHTDVNLLVAEDILADLVSNFGWQTEEWRL